MSNREKLQRQIDEIDKLKAMQHGNPDFESRKGKTKRVLASIFLENSLQFKDFAKISYSPGVISVGGYTDRETPYQKGLEKARVVLSSMIEEIDEELQEEIDEELQEEILDINIDFRKLFKQELIDVSKGLFDDGHYSNAVLEAMKLVNNKVKKIVKDNKGLEFDGAPLMDRAFSLTNPIIRLSDCSGQTEKDIQQGYMALFKGAMLAIRNPKAHDQIQLEKEKAIHFLFLANLLLKRLEEAGY